MTDFEVVFLKIKNTLMYVLYLEKHQQAAVLPL